MIERILLHVKRSRCLWPPVDSNRNSEMPVIPLGVVSSSVFNILTRILKKDFSMHIALFLSNFLNLGFVHGRNVPCLDVPL